MAEQVNMKERPSGPSFAPLPRTSATLNEVLRVCYLRGAFQVDDEFAGVAPPSTAAALGKAAHLLMESAARGDFDDILDNTLEEVIASSWTHAVNSEAQHMQARALGIVPPSARWPRHALRMAATIRAVARVARQRRQRRTEQGQGSGTTQSEVWYEGYGGRLAGRIDLVRQTSSGMELIDYKSGLVIDEDKNEGVEQRIREPYERQIQLYAALIHERHEIWPELTAVESLLDGRHNVDVTPETAGKVVDEALGLLDSYNREAESGSLRGQPTEDSCRWCDYKALCADFFREADDTWTGSSVTVLGVLTEVRAEQPAFLLIDITGGDHTSGPTTVRGLPRDLAIDLKEFQGSTISLSGLRRTLGSQNLMFEWASQCWRWPDSAERQ